MRVRTIYLAGGINGLSDAEATDWREEAKQLIPRSVGVLDPMARDYRGREDANVAEIVNGDLADIKAADAVIAYCPRPSWGTAMEIHHVATMARYVTASGGGNDYEAAKRVTLGRRRVVAIVPADVAVSPWLRHHADEIVPTIAEAVAAVCGEPE